MVKVQATLSDHGSSVHGPPNITFLIFFHQQYPIILNIGLVGRFRGRSSDAKFASCPFVFCYRHVDVVITGLLPTNYLNEIQEGTERESFLQ